MSASSPVGLSPRPRPGPGAGARPRLGRLAVAFGIVGVLSYAGAALIHWLAFGHTGSVRYSTEPMIDWLSIAFMAGPVLLVIAAVALLVAFVSALIVLVRWAVPKRATRAS